MFDKQYRFKGRHALRVDKLTEVFDELSKAKLIDRNVDVYANAPLIGFLYGRTADLDDTKNPETGQVYNENVMGDRVMYSTEELQYNFWLIMLLDANYEPDEEKRIDKAFRHYGKNPDDEDRFDSYVRGGVDVLYEKLVEGESTPEAFANRLWINYFLRMVLLYSNKVCELSESSNNEELEGSLSYLKGNEKEIRKLLK